MATAMATVPPRARADMRRNRMAAR
jgi:hypothetical protein